MKHDAGKGDDSRVDDRAAYRKGYDNIKDFTGPPKGHGRMIFIRGKWYRPGEEPVIRKRDAHNIVSTAAGINPDQIPEMKRKYPHHKYDAKGNMIFKDRQHRLRCLKDIGMHCKNEISGGRSR